MISKNQKQQGLLILKASKNVELSLEAACHCVYIYSNESGQFWLEKRTFIYNFVNDPRSYNKVNSADQLDLSMYL